MWLELWGALRSQQRGEVVDGRLERRVGLDLGAALRALPRSWALCPGKWEVTAKFKKGSDMMKIIFWNKNSFLAVGTLG